MYKVGDFIQFVGAIVLVFSGISTIGKLIPEGPLMSTLRVLGFVFIIAGVFLKKAVESSLLDFHNYHCF